jgi:hypothetical protein
MCCRFCDGWVNGGSWVVGGEFALDEHIEPLDLSFVGFGWTLLQSIW